MRREEAKAHCNEDVPANAVDAAFAAVVDMMTLHGPHQLAPDTQMAATLMGKRSWGYLN